MRANIEAALSFGISQAPQRSSSPNIASGNYISARPLGVIESIDMQYTGSIRKINTDAIRQQLNEGAIVLISPLGYSLSGKTFNLSMGDIAEATAITLQAEKLIYLIEKSGILNIDGQLLTNLNASEAKNLLETNQIDPSQHRLLRLAINAVEHQVTRTQILSGQENGSLIRELFTSHGSGTSVTQNPFMSIRQVHSSDIADIITLIRPFEEQGILLRRSREYLENHIDEFSIP